MQTGNQQAAAGLDRHRDRIFRPVTVVGQQIHKLPIAGGVIADAQLCFDAATAVDKRHVVVGSAWGAVSGLLPARFFMPPSRTGRAS